MVLGCGGSCRVAKGGYILTGEKAVGGHGQGWWMEGVGRMIK